MSGETNTVTRFVLLAEPASSTQVRPEDVIRQFFQDVHEQYLKVILNPFFVPGQALSSASFREKVAAIARKHLV